MHALPSPKPTALVSDPKNPKLKRPVAEIAAEAIAAYNRARHIQRIDGPAYPFAQPYTDPNDEHRLTAHDLVVGKERNNG